jgi:hypothetical protein
VIAVQRSVMVYNLARVRRCGVLAAAVLATGSLAAEAAPSHQGSISASSTQASGLTYGGVSSQDFPVIVDVNSTRSRVVRAVIAIRLNCTAGGFVTIHDDYSKLRIRRAKFGTSFGPVIQRNDDGTTSDLEGSVRGTFNSSRTKVSGTWSFKATDHDAAGAVTDTCDSGSVSWSAKQ